MMNVIIGQMRWKDTQEECRDLIPVNLYEDWMIKNKGNLEVWNGKRWVWLLE